MPDGKSGRHHAAHDKQGRDYGRAAGIDQFAETELKAERKEQYNDAYLRPEVDIGLGGH